MYGGPLCHQNLTLRLMQSWDLSPAIGRLRKAIGSKRYAEDVSV